MRTVAIVSMLGLSVLALPAGKSLDVYTIDVGEKSVDFDSCPM
jgi:hypothetical protein